MDVAAAKAQLELAEASEDFRAAKAAYREKPNEARRAKKREASKRLLAARETWRNKHRVAPSGPGDGTASPAPARTGTEVNG